MNSNFLFDQTFKQVRTLARKFYFKVLGPWDPIVPALGEQVVISEEGWHHLHHKARSKVEMLTRYFALPKIATLFCDAGVRIIYSRGKDGVSEFWALQGTVDGVETKVVVRSLNHGHKHFYSVVWKGELKGTKKEAASRLYPRCGGMDTPQLLYKDIVAQIEKFASTEQRVLAVGFGLAE